MSTNPYIKGSLRPCKRQRRTTVGWGTQGDEKSPENCASPRALRWVWLSRRTFALRPRRASLGQVTTERSLACTCRAAVLPLILERIMHAHHTPSEKLHRSARRDLRTSPIVCVRCVYRKPEICSYVFFHTSTHRGVVGSRLPLPPIHTPQNPLLRLRCDATAFGDVFRRFDAGLAMTTMQPIRDDQAGPGAVAATELHSLLQKHLGD